MSEYPPWVWLLIGATYVAVVVLMVAEARRDQRRAAELAARRRWEPWAQ